MRVTAAAAVFLLAALVLAPAGRAHKGITSKFTYNADVYPVFLKRCSRCHIDGGVGPMSLLKYEDAFPWAESLRTELLLADSRSKSVDPHDFVKSAHRQISARELDIVLEWATGGTPEGDKANPPSPPVLKNDWAAGKPSLTIAMPAYQLPASMFEATQEFVIPVSASPGSVTQVDLLPGNPSIVRGAVISLRSPDGTTRLLGTWFPRQIAAPIPLKPPVRIDPGSSIVARIQYTKTWKFEGEAVSDQSTIGLYAID